MWILLNSTGTTSASCKVPVRPLQLLCLRVEELVYQRSHLADSIPQITVSLDSFGVSHHEVFPRAITR